jgi:anti-sigma factor RsiW
MKPGPATAHANHDESLVVRLYGNDIDSEERSRALALVAGCEECAALYADLGSIAVATAALPAPARPRDFTLTPADATRLRASVPARRSSRWLGLTRQLGGAFAALGLAGVLISGALTALAPASSFQATNYDAAKVGSQAALNVGAAPAASAQPVADGSRGAAVEQPSPNTLVSPGVASAGPSGSGSDATKATVSTPLPPNGSGSVAYVQPVPTAATSHGAGAESVSGGQSTSSGPFDPKPAVLIGSAGLLVLGLLLLVGPRLRARKIRG